MRRVAWVGYTLGNPQSKSSVAARLCVLARLREMQKCGIHEIFVLHFDDGCLRRKLGFLSTLPKYRQGGCRAPRIAFSGDRSGGPLFCAARALAGDAHRSLSRSLWLNVALRVASRSDLLGAGVISPAALLRGVR